MNMVTIVDHIGGTNASLVARYHLYKEVMPVIESFETKGVAGGGAR
jgi:hypothetical protein